MDVLQGYRLLGIPDDADPFQEGHVRRRGRHPATNVPGSRDRHPGVTAESQSAATLHAGSLGNARMRRSLSSLAGLGLTLVAALASARGRSGTDVDVHAPLPPPPAGVAELRFADLFRMPVGPEGLELSERARELDGQRVRMVGYMVREEHVPRGRFLLAPLPIALDSDDEPLADDLPPTTLEVELADAAAEVPFRAGLLVFTGTLVLGARPESDDGRVLGLRLRLDAAASRVLHAAAASGDRRRPRAAP
jgi:hypothetical protein